MGSTAISGELVWPSQNDVYGSGVSGAVGDGKKHLEVQRRKIFGSSAGRNNYIISGGTLPASDVDLVIDVAAGAAIIEGHYCQWPTTSITLPASNTSYIFIKLVFSANLITGLEIEDNTSGTPPTASLQLGTAVTSGSATTSTTDTRLLGPGIVQVLTSGTTFTWPAGVYRIYAEVFGASGGGGGGGEAGTTGGPSDGNNGSSGGAGGTTTFGALTANGGAAGPGGHGGYADYSSIDGTSGAHGTASGGTVNLTGQGQEGGIGGTGGVSAGTGGAGGSGASGGNGGYSAGWISGTPGGTTSYGIGAAGTAGAGGTGTAGADGSAGTVGLAGVIVLHY